MKCCCNKHFKICTTTAVCDYYPVDGTDSSLVDQSAERRRVMPGHIEI